MSSFIWLLILILVFGVPLLRNLRGRFKEEKGKTLILDKNSELAKILYGSSEQVQN